MIEPIGDPIISAKRAAGERRINEEFWIDTFGKIHRWKGDALDAEDYYSLHYGIADQLHPDVQNPVYFLEIQGWIRVRSVVHREACQMYREPTQAQINAMFDIGFVRRESAYNDPNCIFFYKERKI